MTKTYTLKLTAERIEFILDGLDELHAKTQQRLRRTKAKTATPVDMIDVTMGTAELQAIDTLIAELQRATPDVVPPKPAGVPLGALTVAESNAFDLISQQECWTPVRAEARPFVAELMRKGWLVAGFSADCPEPSEGAVAYLEAMRRAQA